MQQPNKGTTSVLARLRSLTPRRGLTAHEALSIADRQAALLLDLHDVTDGPIPLSLLSGLPRIELATEADLPSSGMSYWTGEVWRLVARADEHPHRQRFSLAHEYKHVIDNPVRDLLYPNHRSREQAADQFAASLLMPKRLVTRAWCAGEQDLQQLADLFQVSTIAMQRRLTDLGLSGQIRRVRYLCARGRVTLPTRSTFAIGGGSTASARPGATT